jgi:hypothetical protein
MEHLWWHRAIRICATFGHRLWRGHRGRSIARRAFVMSTLPDPSSATQYEFWKDLQRECQPHRHKRGIFAEYTVGGTPLTWSDRNKEKGNSGNRCEMYRDVRFYVNALTLRAQWNMPDFWRVALEEEFEAREMFRVLGYPSAILGVTTQIQGLWRARRSRHYFRHVMTAMHMAQNAYKTWAKDPKDIKSICNYALTLHVWHHDLDQARPFYDLTMNFMELRGADNSFVLYAYAIFCAATGDHEWDEIQGFVSRAKEATKNSKSGTSAFTKADVGFFRQKALQSGKDDGRGWHNYALCRMLVYGDVVGAKAAFLNSLEASALDNERAITNFDYLLLNYSSNTNKQDDNELRLTALEEYQKFRQQEAKMDQSCKA